MSSITISIDKELDITTYTIEEDATYLDIHDAIDDYFKDIPTKYTIWDFSKLKKHLTSDEVRMLAEQVGTLGKDRKEGGDLIIVPNILQYGLARMYTAYIETVKKSPAAFKTLVFRKKEDAMDWIRQNAKK